LTIMRPRILMTCDFFLPGFKGGGALRSVVNIARACAAEFEWHVITGDRDNLDPRPYDSVPFDCWHPIDGIQVMYLSAGGRRLARLTEVLRATPHDLLYLNSLFSPHFTLKPLLLRLLGRLPQNPVLLAPRGELAPGCLAVKPARKRTWLGLARPARLYRDLLWHASGPDEAAMIQDWFPGARVLEAADLPSPPHATPANRPPKRPGQLSVGYVSRITSNKNFGFAIEAIRGLAGEVTLNAYGPVEDTAYWDACLARAATLPSNIRLEAHGALPHHRVAEVLAQQDVMLLPSHAESFGHVIAEALAAGCPVLLSDRTPWHDVERDGVGWELPLDRPERFTERLQALVAMDEAEHAAMRARSRQVAAAVARRAAGPTRELFLTALAAGAGKSSMRPVAAK
jgi:glycosyltransferase involved in cell wall biosynthesis